jgi:hypothetical protein
MGYYRVDRDCMAVKGPYFQAAEKEVGPNFATITGAIGLSVE